jgi:glycerol-3-phosphate acyltransferase PlsY
MESLIICLILGYLLGSLPFAVIVSRLFGLADPRQHGSRNPGATNVLRTGHKLAAALTLLGDAAKGWLAMFVAAKLGAGETAVLLAGFAAFCGHLFPVFLGFKGGKGVATALGVLLGVHWSLALAGFLVWLLVAVTTRYSSLAALSAAATAPVFAWLLIGRWETITMVSALALMLVYRHKANITRLLAGTESKIGKG